MLCYSGNNDELEPALVCRHWQELAYLWTLRLLRACWRSWQQPASLLQLCLVSAGDAHVHHAACASAVCDLSQRHNTSVMPWMFWLWAPEVVLANTQRPTDF